MLSTKNITSLRPKVKWSNKFMGPYTVVGQAGANAYKLDLPNSLKIHPVFHTSLLLPYRENKIDNREQPPPPPVIIDNNVEWEVDKIIDSQMYYGHLQYLVKWHGLIILRQNGFGQKIWIIVQISLMNSRALILNREYRSLRGCTSSYTMTDPSISNSSIT